MPNISFDRTIKKRSENVFIALLDYALKHEDFEWKGLTVSFDTDKPGLQEICGANKYQKQDQYRSTISDHISYYLPTLLGSLFVDKRSRKDKGAGRWKFDVTFWSLDLAENILRFNEEWEAKKANGCFKPIDSKPETSPPQATELRIVIHGCSIEQVGRQLVWEQLQSLIPSHSIEIVSITRGSVVIAVRSSTTGIQELYNQYQNGTFDRLLGFPIAKLEILSDRRSEPPQQRLFGGIPDVPSPWVGRDGLLAELHRELVAEKKVIAIVGQGGMGKTSLAAKAIESIGVDIKAKVLTQACLYERVLFFTVENNAGFETVAAALLEMLEPGVAASQTPREMIARIITGLNRYRYLVVLDNLESLLRREEVGRAIDIEVDNLLNALAYKGHKSQIIITSRESPQGLKDRRGDEVDIKLVKEVEIEGSSIADSIELLRQLGLTDTEEDLAWIADRVGGNTLILTLLAGYAQGQPGLLWQEQEIVCDKADPVINAQFERQSAAERELLRRMC
ncbi:AAA family ATPase, partial [Chamaesiphon sp. VAR_48_metabat_135_sub]|uniref:AAA family ATPase n=1 Tax=Chamaesiphon sp. VAR_48_metabat_135_sub TaxID=2964699 RepID=UPI00286CF66A